MHPAFSIIFFTVGSGAGYGLLAALGVLSALGLLPRPPPFGLVVLALALALATAGLLASTLHLSHPDRAWRAFSQWRSSWLSREGITSLLTYGPAILFGIAWFAFGTPTAIVNGLGLLAAAMAMLTVYCTAMIYRSLRPIHQWHNAWVVPNYLALSIYTGALLLNAVTVFFAGATRAPGVLALLAGLIALFCKLGYWRFIDGSRAVSTPESATGLGGIGRVRFFEAPHTEENYLLKEMGFRIGRKHAAKLRIVALVAGFAVSLVLTCLAVWSLTLGMFAAPLAVISAAVGFLAERWLFFAEAKHTVRLYYGAVTA